MEIDDLINSVEKPEPSTWSDNKPTATQSTEVTDGSGGQFTAINNNSFMWNGRSSSKYGIIMLSPPTYTIAKERYSSISVPGRSGNLTISEGEAVYDNIQLSCTCMVKDNSEMVDIATWLRGLGTVRFYDRYYGYYKARVSNQIPFEKIVRGNKNRTFTLMFDCEPFFYLTDDNYSITVYNTRVAEAVPNSGGNESPVHGDDDDDNGDDDNDLGENGESISLNGLLTDIDYMECGCNLKNLGNYYSNPKITIWFNKNDGNDTNDMKLVVKNNLTNKVISTTTILHDKVFKSSGSRRLKDIVIDSESKFVSHLSSAHNDYISGDWPVFPASKNFRVELENNLCVRKIVIRPRWRCIA